jgi:formiminotetrahydrofolate cyclodeaminase
MLAREIAASGNRASVSDAGVAALMGRAGAEGAALNVLINLGSIGDAAFRASAEREALDLVTRVRRTADETLATVNAALPVAATWLPSGPETRGADPANQEPGTGRTP